MATAWCEEQDYDTTVVIPGDIPLVTSAELYSVLDAAPAEGALIVPAYDRRGSNCVLRRPANRHSAALRQRQFSAALRSHAPRPASRSSFSSFPGIGLDIDQPHELDLLLQRDGDTHAQRLLRAWGYAGPNTAAWEAAG